MTLHPTRSPSTPQFLIASPGSPRTPPMRRGVQSQIFVFNDAHVVTIII